MAVVTWKFFAPEPPHYRVRNPVDHTIAKALVGEHAGNIEERRVGGRAAVALKRKWVNRGPKGFPHKCAKVETIPEAASARRVGGTPASGLCSKSQSGRGRQALAWSRQASCRTEFGKHRLDFFFSCKFTVINRMHRGINDPQLLMRG